MKPPTAFLLTLFLSALPSYSATPPATTTAPATTTRPTTSTATRSATTSRPEPLMTPATFDPARIRMKIETFQITPPKVGSQCTGSLTILNTGPGYAQDPAHVLPYWTLTIADSKGTPLYTGSGAWSGPMNTNARITLNFDTHSNSLPDPPGKPFLFPAPDKYAVTMTLYPGRDLKTPVDTKTLTVEVPKPAPATTTRPTTTRTTTTQVTTRAATQPR
jgi:hypothetical protein